MPTQHFLALDLGAESGRGVVGTIDDRQLTLREAHRFVNPTGRMLGHWHWNLLGQWEELKTALRKATRWGDGDIKLSGIGVDTWGVDFGLIDANGDILGNPFHYRDSRSDGMMQRVFERVPRERVFAVTGIQFMQFNTLYQLYAMRRANHPSLRQARNLLFMPDLFNYLFTGNCKCEYTIASTSQMLDVQKGIWAAGLLEELDIPSHILGEIVPPGSILGLLRDEIAQECSVDAVPVIAPATHDTASAVVAVPAQSSSWCYISSGTWSLMGVELGKPIVSAKALGYNYTNEGGVNGTVRFLRNIMGLWLVQECRRHWQKGGMEISYGQLAEMAVAIDGPDVLINPDHGLFGTPGGMPAKIARFCAATGQKTPASPAQFVRVCLDSLAMAYRRALAQLEDVMGRRIEVIHIVGGGCQNELLNQLTADACGRRVVAGPVEATAMGNILVQAMAVGAVRNLEDARAIVRQSVCPRRYEPRDTAIWDRAYDRYCQIFQAPIP